MAKEKVYDRVKKEVGLENCTLAYTTAAPIKEATRKFFFQVNIPLLSLYGMSETAAPFVVTHLPAFQHFTP